MRGSDMPWTIGQTRPDDHPDFDTEPLYPPPVCSVPPGWKLVPLDDMNRECADSQLPFEMIAAGMDVLDKVDEDERSYVAGETDDWDQGMIVVAVYRAMMAAAPKAPSHVIDPRRLAEDRYRTVLRELGYAQHKIDEVMDGEASTSEVHLDLVNWMQRGIEVALEELGLGAK